MPESDWIFEATIGHDGEFAALSDSVLPTLLAMNWVFGNVQARHVDLSQKLT